MRIFVSEYIAGGALSGTSLPPSLLREGQAMLTSIIADFLAIAGCHLVTTVDRRLAESIALPSSTSLTMVVVDHPSDEQRVYSRECSNADATLVIAPETDNVLHQRVQAVLDLGRPSLNCSPAAIELCGDKLRLATHLAQRGIATIPTDLLHGDAPPWKIVRGDSVIKPRDGAGSWLTALVRKDDHAEWQAVRKEFIAEGALDRAIVQPWISGTPLSVGCLSTSSGGIEMLPIARQHLTASSFQYQGGSLPVRLEQSTTTAIETLVQSACCSIAGLRGYIGVDLLLPDQSPSEPVLVEINPRLTTSYVGYRKLSQNNLAVKMLASVPELASGLADEPLTWRAGRVEFDASGDCRISAD